MLLLRASQLSSPAQKRVIRAVRAVMDLGPSWPRWRASHSSRTLCLKAARASASGQSTIWFFLTRNLVQSFLADSPGCWTMWLRSSASGGRTYVPRKLSRKASSKSFQLPMEFSGKLFNQYRAGPFSFSRRYLMACRSSPWAISMWRIKSSVHTRDRLFRRMIQYWRVCILWGIHDPLLHHWSKAGVRHLYAGPHCDITPLRFSARAWRGLTRPNR